jgi:lipopolysaccharide biosynthesis glycosyltransferase
MVAPLAHPTDVMVLIDADIIVTRPLTGLIDEARSGKIVAFADTIDRFDERWSELLGLGTLRRQPYVNSGLLVAERQLGTRLLERVSTCSEQVDVARSCIGNGSPDYPFYYLDQDVLNALLATYAAEELELLDHRLAPFPPFVGVRVVDEAALRCSYEDGREPFALHHIQCKPWISATRWNVYSHLLARLLLREDVALPLRRDEVPLRLRTGGIAWLEKRRSDALAALRAVRARLALRTRLAGRAGRN